MRLLGGHHLAHHRAGQMEDIALGEDIEACLAVHGHHVHAHHGAVAGLERVRNERRARVKGIGAERNIGGF